MGNKKQINHNKWNNFRHLIKHTKKIQKKIRYKRQKKNVRQIHNKINTIRRKTKQTNLKYTKTK